MLDIAELDAGRVAKVDFPNINDLTQFIVTVEPDSGFWAGAKYHFAFVIPSDYPHKPPKVTCSPKIYHPNLNYEGAVCLNILREDWKPVLDINAVIYGLIYLFYEPNPDDPLNREAADLFRNDKNQVSIAVVHPAFFSITNPHILRLVCSYCKAYFARVCSKWRVFRKVDINHH